MPSDPHPRSAGPRASAKLAQIAQLGPWAEMGGVAGVVLILALVLAPLNFATGGAGGLMATVIAGGTALAAALLATAVGRLFRGSKRALHALLAGMLIRMSVVLALALVLKFQAPQLVGGAMILNLLVFYLATLAIETLLAIAKTQDSTGPRNVDPSGPALPKAV